MEIPKYIEVKTVDGQRAAFLSPNDGESSIKDCFIDCRLNAESTLEFYIPAISEKITELTPECQIWAGGRVYTLLQPEAVDTVRDEKNTLWTKFMAVERWKNLETSYVEPYLSNDPSIPHPADLAVIIVGGGTNLSGGLYQTGTAAHALHAVLKGSGWTMGTCDVTGIHDLEMEKVSRLDLIREIQNIWGGYLVWDSVNKIVHLRDGGKWQNYTGFQVRYKKNLKHITRTQSNRIITKLYCFGHDDLDIASVNGGVKYLTNHSYTSREYIGIYKNQDIYNAQELKEKATAELSLICHPRYKYTVKMVDTRTLPEFSHEEFAVGDMVDVVDETVAPETPRIRLIRHKYNIFKPWICELEIGDPFERIEEDLKAAFDTTTFIDNTFKGNGQLSGYDIENLSIANSKIQNLEANKITTNEAKIKTAQIENLEVGGNVAMGPNATISWNQVTNQPTIPVLPSYITQTKITSTTVESPIIVGGEIRGGKLTSDSTINVTTDAYIGNNLYLGNYASSGSLKKIYFNSGAWIGNNNDFTGYGIEINCSSLKINGWPEGSWDFSNAGGATGSFVSADGKTIIIKGGLVTKIT
ncbi:phage tail protein [Ruminiclostridium josui]|uniref:phage tail protein n=1 Tax=Ruminiclostridium josui TaxID=1499 RepID=UPI0004654AF5|nr:phage tail protein [Ruminiclostridium josui]